MKAIKRVVFDDVEILTTNFKKVVKVDGKFIDDYKALDLTVLDEIVKAATGEKTDFVQQNDYELIPEKIKDNFSQVTVEARKHPEDEPDRDIAYAVLISRAIKAIKEYYEPKVVKAEEPKKLESPFKMGMRVSHEKFGLGTVVNVEYNTLVLFDNSNCSLHNASASNPKLKIPSSRARYFGLYDNRIKPL